MDKPRQNQFRNLEVLPHMNSHVHVGTGAGAAKDITMEMRSGCLYWADCDSTAIDCSCDLWDLSAFYPNNGPRQDVRHVAPEIA